MHMFALVFIRTPKIGHWSSTISTGTRKLAQTMVLYKISLINCDERI